MNCSVAQAARALADWKPNSSGRRRADAEAIHALLDESSGFRRTLLSRLRWACKARGDISSRFPVDACRSPRAVDEDLLGELAQEVVMLLLKPGRPFGSRNAFGVLADRMEKKGEGDWTDAECLVFLLGKKDEHYDLPRRNRATGACPAIWLWVAMHWRPRSRRQQESHSIFRRTGIAHRGQTEAEQRAVGRDESLPADAATGSEDGQEAAVGNPIAEVRKWPAEQRNLLIEALRPESGILKTATVERLRKQKVKYADEVARCFSVSAVSRFLGLARRVAEGQVRKLSERLLSLPVGQSVAAIEALRAALLADGSVARTDGGGRE